MLAEDQAELVLHADHREDGLGRLDLLDTDLGQTHVADQALALHLGYGAELILTRHGRIDAVQLPQVDALQLQPAQAEMHVLAQIFRPPQLGPLGRPGAAEPALGGDGQAVIGGQGLGDQILRHFRPIGGGCVDEVHPQFRQAPQGGQHPGPVRRLAPHPRPGDAHGAIAQAGDVDIAAEQEAAGGGGIGRGHGRGPRRYGSWP